MSVSVRSVGNVRIVEPAGALSIGQSSLATPLDFQGQRLADLGTTLEELLRRGQTNILLNLHRVNFMDSAGIGELVTWKTRMSKSSGDLKLLKPTERVRQLLDLTHLDQLFEIYDHEQAALRSFS